MVDHIADDIPHFAFPFQLRPDGTRPVTRYQDDPDEIVDCVEVLLSTHRGERQELPSYGIPDLAFEMGGAGAHPEELVDAVALWEPRAETSFEQTELNDMIERIAVTVAPRGPDA